jgi:hypothetical protein
MDHNRWPEDEGIDSCCKAQGPTNTVLPRRRLPVRFVRSQLLAAEALRAAGKESNGQSDFSTTCRYAERFQNR